ncbi:hypothetical protein BV22DRAFT_678530 [Leucogyrophana mollusca]|uniref:Uncharacterized protein n=1 Tax=Leucogyrophana mollusca TaxID=85980 RepID=A0ACB8B9A3_9AGAM|nr:hypothetical protein BV22DRAFT_678530 [Leucogyrophana mollusca]
MYAAGRNLALVRTRNLRAIDRIRNQQPDKLTRGRHKTIWLFLLSVLWRSLATHICSGEGRDPASTTAIEQNSTCNLLCKLMLDAQAT